MCSTHRASTQAVQRWWGLGICTWSGIYLHPCNVLWIRYFPRDIWSQSQDSGTLTKIYNCKNVFETNSRRNIQIPFLGYFSVCVCSTILHAFFFFFSLVLDELCFYVGDWISSPDKICIYMHFACALSMLPKTHCAAPKKAHNLFHYVASMRMGTKENEIFIVVHGSRRYHTRVIPLAWFCRERGEYGQLTLQSSI